MATPIECGPPPPSWSPSRPPKKRYILLFGPRTAAENGPVPRIYLPQDEPGRIYEFGRYNDSVCVSYWPFAKRMIMPWGSCNGPLSTMYGCRGSGVREWPKRYIAVSPTYGSVRGM